jgi:hypothetical protein
MTTTIAVAEQAGRQAFADGKVCTPALDANLMAILKGHGNGVLPLIEAWLKGWTAANLAAPVAELVETFGEPISVYSRAQAIEDGMLVDVTEWGSRDKGFHGGYACPVAFTAAVWSDVKVEGTRRSGDTRGRAHDVLWMSSLAMRRAMAKGEDRASFVVKLGRLNVQMMVVADGDGITIGYRSDF